MEKLIFSETAKFRNLEATLKIIKTHTRASCEILIAAKQVNAKLQTAKSTEDENSEGKI